MGLMLVSFLLSLMILPASLIMLVKTTKKIRAKQTYNRIAFALYIAGTVIGLVLFTPPAGLIIYIRSINSTGASASVDTGVTVYWEGVDGADDYFTLDRRRYTYLNIAGSQNAESIEIDQAIANIVPDNYHEMLFFRLLFGWDTKQTIYSIRNSPDRSILTTGGEDSVYYALFVDETLIESKAAYYRNLDNYDFYYSRDAYGHEKTGHAVPLYEYHNVKGLYEYTGVETEIPRKGWEYLDYKGVETDDKDYEYLTIYGISRDRIIHKFIAPVIIDGGHYYREESERLESIRVTVLPAEYKQLVITLLGGRQ